MFIEEGRDFLKEFNEFILSPTCPTKVNVSFQRIQQRVLTKSFHKDPTSQIQAVDYAHFSMDISEETEEAVNIASTFPAGCGDDEDT